MNDFNPDPRCAKCEATNTTFRYTNEHLHVTCCHCGHTWNQKAADDPNRICVMDKR